MGIVDETSTLKAAKRTCYSIDKLKRIPTTDLEAILASQNLLQADPQKVAMEQVSLGTLRQMHDLQGLARRKRSAKLYRRYLATS